MQWHSINVDNDTTAYAYRVCSTYQGFSELNDQCLAEP